LIGPSQKEKINKKMLKLWRLSPKVEDYIERWRSALPLWPTYIYMRRGGLWAKHMGIKAWCYWEHPWGEHIGNLKNILRT
jgi:hypothetical protein